MSVSKKIILDCARDMRDEIESAEVIARPFEWEDNGNYVFVGVRHVGKSYMMYQRVKELLTQGIGWDEILYVNFDDERLAELTTEDLNLLIETHLETWGKKPHVFLDEIQNVPHWDKFVRRLANEKYHICVTGSNARMLSKDVATTLGGRFFIVEVYPFSFHEYLRANQVELTENWQHSTLERANVSRLMNEYIKFGGLPEITGFRNKRATLSSLYQKIYLSDICTRNGIKNDRVLNIMIKKLAESVKQPISFNRLRNIVVSTGHQISLPSVIDYVGYAIDSWLLIPIENEIAKLSDKESIKKYYFIDNGILNLFLTDEETSLIENMVAVELCRRYDKKNVTYLNDGGREIDFIVADRQLAIQASYSIKDADTRNREIAPLLRFGASHPGWKLLVITHDESELMEQNGLQIEVVPFWKWTF